MTASSALISFAELVLGVSVFIFIMLLPALLELKKPSDAGPRMIMDYVGSVQLPLQIAALEESEDKPNLDKAILKKVADLIAVLPNLEK